MKIVLITDIELSFNTAGASRMLYIAKELAKQGIPATVIGRKPSQEIYIDGITFMFITGPKKKNRLAEFLFRLRFPLFIAPKCVANKFEWFFIRGYWIGAFLIPVLKLFQRKAIFDFHGYEYREQIVEGRILRAKITKLLEKISLSLADKIVVVSEGMKKMLPDKYYKKTIYLPNGVDPNIFKGEIDKNELNLTMRKYHIFKDKKKVGFVGFWGTWHNIEDLLQCINYLAEVQIIIVGKGANLEKFKQEYNHPFVIFTGPVKKIEVLTLYKLMDIMIIPYSNTIYMAGIPGYFSARKTIEYLAAGKPIIVSDIAGKESFLKEKENMLSYKPGHPEDLAQKIQQLLADPSLYQRMCQNNLRLAEEFSWEKIVLKSNIIPE